MHMNLYATESLKNDRQTNQVRVHNFQDNTLKEDELRCESSMHVYAMNMEILLVGRRHTQLERSAVFELFSISHHISKAYHMLHEHFTTSLDRQMLLLYTHSAYLTHSQFVDDLLV